MAIIGSYNSYIFFASKHQKSKETKHSFTSAQNNINFLRERKEREKERKRKRKRTRKREREREKKKDTNYCQIPSCQHDKNPKNQTPFH
jgi:septal ring factor EnvC (AmiA/AmiB activator)